jgi:hypothetical protein
VWQRQTEPFIAIFVTPDEMMALSDAIVCYLGYLQRIPALVQEYAETIQLLQCFQQKLTSHVNLAQSAVQDGEVWL